MIDDGASHVILTGRALADAPSSVRLPEAPNLLTDRGDVHQPSYGGWCTIPNPYVVELLAASGLAWICVDAQHGLIDNAGIVGLLGAAAITGTPAWVRVRWNDAATIMQALDAGAIGVIIPMVNSAEEASRAARACRYPPKGDRSWGPSRVPLRVDRHDVDSANRRVRCGVMVETLQAFGNLDEILSVPGVDMVFVGPSDLAVDMGLSPTTMPVDGKHRAALMRIAAACDERGVLAGVYGGDVATARAYVQLGYRFVAVVNDAQLISRGANRAVEQLAGVR